MKIDLPFEEAVRGLLEVDPDSEPVEPDKEDSGRGSVASAAMPPPKWVSQESPAGTTAHA